MTPYSSCRTLYSVEQRDTNLNDIPTVGAVVQKEDEEYEPLPDASSKPVQDKEDTVQEDYETIPHTQVSINTSQNSMDEEQYTYMEGFGNIPPHEKTPSEEELYESIAENN